MLRVGIGVGILFLVGMLYWSSLLLETEVGELRSEITRLKVEMSRPVVIQQQVVEAPAPSNFSNLLERDPFYEETLPAMLGASFVPTGTMRSATIGKPKNLHPFAGWKDVMTAVRSCNVSIAQPLFGQYERFAPSAALRVEERAPGEYWVFLREDLEWAPLDRSHFPAGFELAPQFLERYPVTAHDFKFNYDAIMNPYVSESGAAAQRNYLGDIESFEVVDDYTFVVRWREQEGKVKYIARPLTMGLQPLATWVYQFYPDGSRVIDGSDYRNDSVWAQAFSQHWSQNVIPSCGAWLFDGMSDNQVRLRRNPDYFDPHGALSEGWVLTFKESPDGVWQDFKAMGSDTFESRIAPEKVAELAAFEESGTYRNQQAEGSGIQQIDFLDRSYRYIGWNLANPLFASKRVRQALTMAIDRKRLIGQVLNGLGEEITGPLYPLDSSYDGSIEPWSFDLVEARRLLEAEGWIDHDGDGIRDKMIDGKRVKFSFNLMYYVKSTSLRVTIDFIATALREIGIECRPMGVDVADLGAAFEGKEFDAICMGWTLGAPPSEPKQLWHSSGAKEKGSSNAVGFANAEADAIIEALQYEHNLDKRDALYHRFHQIIHDEQPYTFLHAPKQAFLYREYVQNVFVPYERQDLVPGAAWTQPASSIFWIKQDGTDG